MRTPCSGTRKKTGLNEASPPTFFGGKRMLKCAVTSTDQSVQRVPHHLERIYGSNYRYPLFCCMVNPCFYLFCSRSLGLFDCWRIIVSHWNLAWFLFVVQMKKAYNFAVSGFAALGLFAFLMFAFGYLYASIPLAKTCTPTFVDRIFK